MSDYLIHYGVLGMKWGVRKQQNRINKYNARRQKALDRSRKYDEKLFKTRQEYYDKTRSKWDKKIQKATDKGNLTKATAYKNKKAYKLQDHASLTRQLKRGSTIYNRNINNYYNAKVKSIRDPEFKKSSQYKTAMRTKILQDLNDANYYGEQWLTKGKLGGQGQKKKN